MERDRRRGHLEEARFGLGEDQRRGGQGRRSPARRPMCGQFQTGRPGVEPVLAVEGELGEVEEETQVLRTGSLSPQSRVHDGWGGAGPCPECVVRDWRREERSAPTSRVKSGPESLGSCQLCHPCCT